MLMKYSRNYRKISSCDICYKNSSFANKTCNKCFWILISRKKYK